MGIWKTQPLEILSALSNLPVKDLQSLHHEHNLNVSHFFPCWNQFNGKVYAAFRKILPRQIGIRDNESRTKICQPKEEAAAL